MYRFHIKPIQQHDASSQVRSMYKDIQDVLNLQAVPLVFQYVANYERYFVYIWERMRTNLLSQEFYQSCKEIRSFTEQAVGYMETPSDPLTKFVKTLHPAELSQIRSTTDQLDATNLRMMLLMIGVRESIKGIYQARNVLPGRSEDENDQTLDELLQMKRSTAEERTPEATKAARMLAPLFGNNTLMLSRYPDFFGHIANEMERLENMEAYLLTRVGLEHLGFAYIEQFVSPLNCSYAEFMRLTDGTGYVDEILYLLKDTFPSRFPHLVLTTGVMKKALLKESHV